MGNSRNFKAWQDLNGKIDSTTVYSIINMNEAGEKYSITDMNGVSGNPKKTYSINNMNGESDI